SIEKVELMTFDKAIETLTELLNAEMSQQIHNRHTALLQYFRLRKNGQTCAQASNCIAEVMGKGKYFSRCGRYYWAPSFLKTGIVEPSKQGRHIKSQSILQDEDAVTEIQAFLRSQKYDITSKSLRNFINMVLFPSFGVDQPGKIATRTARKWLNTF